MISIRRKSEAQPPQGDAGQPGDAGSTPGAALPTSTPTQAQPTTMDVSEKTDRLLQERGRKLNMVDQQSLFQSVEQAVGLALQRHLAGEIAEETVSEIATDSRRALVHLVRKRGKAVRGLPEQAFLKKVTQSRDKIVGERDAANAQLAKLLDEFEGKSQALLAKESILEQESRAAGAWHDKVLAEQIEAAFDAMPRTPEMDAVRAQVLEVALNSIQGERQKVIDEKVSDHRSEIENYQRRIAKLTESLKLTEGEMARVAAAKSIDLGVASIYRGVQGIGDEDALKEQKKELMSAIFDANMAMLSILDSDD